MIDAPGRSILQSLRANQDLAGHKYQDALRHRRLSVEGADAVLTLLERQRGELLRDQGWPLNLLALQVLCAASGRTRKVALVTHVSMRNTAGLSSFAAAVTVRNRRAS